jgi:hypothetical protein
MPRWLVDYLGKRRQHSGTGEARNEREAITKAAESGGALAFLCSAVWTHGVKAIGV